MKNILMFLATALVSFGANAEMTIMGLTESTQKLQQQNNQMSGDIAIAKKDFGTADKARLAAEKEYDLAYDEWKKTSGGLFGFFQGSGDPALKTKMEAAKGKMEGARQSVDALSGKVEALELNARELASKAAKEEKDLKAAQKALAAALTAEELVSEFSRIEAKVGNSEQALKTLELRYDNTTLAAYVRSKMGAMLNSDVMCQAQKNCADGATKTPITDKQLKESVFNKGASSSSSSNKSSGVN